MERREARVPQGTRHLSRVPTIRSAERRSAPSLEGGRKMKAAPRALRLPGPMNHACINDADVMRLKKRGLFDM